MARYCLLGNGFLFPVEICIIHPSNNQQKWTIARTLGRASPENTGWLRDPCIVRIRERNASVGKASKTIGETTSSLLIPAGRNGNDSKILGPFVLVSNVAVALPGKQMMLTMETNTRT